MTRVVFMGTPAFALPTLERLIESYEVVGVLTQPDRRAGRGQRMVASPVKEMALAHGLPVLQPRTLRRPEAVEQLRALGPEVIVVAAYGLILPPAVLEIPPHGCLNIHASLLPKYRGAAPIPAAILAGEAETGITIMLMDEGMDTGPILSQARLAIEPHDTTQSLSEKLAPLGADLLMETLPRWLEGEIEPRLQDESQASYCKLIHKEDGLINWSLPAIQIERAVRAYTPWPSAYTFWEGRLLKILRAQPLVAWSGHREPGQVMELPQGIAVATGQGALLLEEVQLAGRRAMGAEEFVRGQRRFVGATLGNHEGKASYEGEARL
ncbi:MAG: methionyl-tRNA formyltransferase [Anaerolineae bacterium]